MQSTISVILPTWAVFSLSLSLPPQILPKSTLSQTNGKQDVARHLEATRGKHGLLCFIFRLWVIIKALLKKFPYICCRIIVLTCPDNKSARNHQRKSCVPAPNHANHNDARPIILKSSLPFSLFLFVWRLESTTTTKSLLRHLISGIAEDLHCLKAIDRNFVRNGGTTGLHSSFAVGLVYPNKSPTMTALLTSSFENISNTVPSV